MTHEYFESLRFFFLVEREEEKKINKIEFGKNLMSIMFVGCQKQVMGATQRQN